MASLYKHHATLEISRQINLDKKRPDPREEKLRKAYQTLEALDLFLVSPEKMQIHTPKVHQQLFERLENLYFDYIIRTVFSNQLNSLGDQPKV